MTTEVITFPDAAGLLKHPLTELLDDPVHTKVPATRPARFHQLQRTGGPRMNLLADEPQITITSWAPTEAEAMLMAQAARAAFHSLRGTVVDGHTLGRTGELGGPADDPDPDSGTPRCSQILTIGIRGVRSTR